MSQYSIDYLQNHTRIGDVAKNGLPWTARGLDLNSSGVKWLFDGKVPLKVAKELFASFAVESRPMAQIREAREGDTFPQFMGEDGKFYSVIVDSTRQAISDAARDRLHFVPKHGYVIHDFTETLIARTARIIGDSQGSLHIDSVGVLADGGEGWVSVATDGLLSLPEGVDYYPHVLASSSHTGTLASSLQAVVTMTVCDNTRACALGEGKRNGTVTKRKHSRESSARMAEDENEAREVLGLLDVANETFAASVKSLCETAVTDAQMETFISVLAPISDDSSKNAITRAENFRDSVLNLYRNDARNVWQGTAFGALQAVNTFDLWERSVHAGTDYVLRNMRDTITGKSDTREESNREVLLSVLSAA